jgi:hypothetical protein
VFRWYLPLSRGKEKLSREKPSITGSMKEINFHPPNLSLKGEGITG